MEVSLATEGQSGAVNDPLTLRFSNASLDAGKAYTVGVRVLNPGGRPPEATNYWGISLQDHSRDTFDANLRIPGLDLKSIPIRCNGLGWTNSDPRVLAYVLIQIRVLHEIPAGTLQRFTVRAPEGIMFNEDPQKVSVLPKPLPLRLAIPTQVAGDLLSLYLDEMALVEVGTYNIRFEVSNPTVYPHDNTWSIFAMKDITMEFVHVMTGYYEGQASPFDINVAAQARTNAAGHGARFSLLLILIVSVSRIFVDLQVLNGCLYECMECYDSTIRLVLGLEACTMASQSAEGHQLVSTVHIGEIRLLKVEQHDDLEMLSDPMSPTKDWPVCTHPWIRRVALGLVAIVGALALRHRWEASRTKYDARDVISMRSRGDFRGVALNSGDANYDTVFNQTLFDCVQTAKKGAEGKCFDTIYGADTTCRELAKDPLRGTCMGIQACLTGQAYGPLPNPCDKACGDEGHEHMLKSCHVQFSALRLLSRTCVPKWVIHDQKTDWRLYQVRDMINGIAKRCGRPIRDIPFFNT
ncbi:hypothetical protein AK812_SmicGene36226 [Symbiodinium microadriaticum]|uniref:Uncharacterized protein n=1 Tax=Symbiodinium microadriaticum TaxID=2951 RepID=A0A1Q9CJF4_SYMMI|nr:hypothetical protein AK812_SmicGene36226 [Symbiodinium microadriaticum]